MRNTKKTHSVSNKARHKKKLSFSRIQKLKNLARFTKSVPRIDCLETSKRNCILAVQALMKKNKPFVICFASNSESAYPFFRAHSQEILLEEITKILKRSFPKKIDVNTSKNGIFSGNYRDQETMSLDFQDFLKYNGEKTLYLAQLPLYKRLRKTDFYKKGRENLHGLNAHLSAINKNQKTALNMKFPYPLSTLLRHQKLDSINLWLSQRPTTSNWHYDSYDNFLCMVSGFKKIRLLSPKQGPKILNTTSILEPFYNQAREKGRRSRKELRLVLKPNEALFIPQGWYHHIRSHGNDLILGLSLWFNSIEDDEYFKGREDYFLRYLLLKKCERESKRNVKEFMKERLLGKLDNLNPNEIRDFLSKISQQPDALQEFLLNLKGLEVEFLTNLLENIDKKLPNNKVLLEKLKEGRAAEINAEISDEIDKFYKVFWGNVDSKFFLEWFLEWKKKLKTVILHEIVDNL